MSLEAARNLSISDLLHLLNEKLGLEYTRLRETHLPPVTSAASLESEIEVLEARTHGILRFLASLRNILQPANRLPPEIISYIARHVSRAGIDIRWVIPLTHVCRYWRESIISAPEHWTTISCYRKGQAILSLQRSKSAPLQLILDIGILRQDPEFRDLIMPHIQNTKTLQFDDFPTIEDFTQVVPNFPQSMPNLRSLGLERSSNEPDWDPPIDPFKSFPHTLRSLLLSDIPLYPSFLKIRTLTKLSLRYYSIRAPLGSILDLLEKNRSLESVELGIGSDGPLVLTSQRRVAITSRLQHLLIDCCDAMTIRTLISSIPLRRGAYLGIHLRSEHGLNDILSGISMTHLANLPLPTSMEYHSACSRVVQLYGPNGTFSYYGGCTPAAPFMEFPMLPLTNIRELRLVHSDPFVVFHPSSFPALEALSIGYHTDVSHLFFALFPNPSFFSSLKTLGFLDCVLTEEFMEELMWFAFSRKNTTSTWLHRVVIVHPEGNFPTADSISKLRNHVPVVDTRLGRRFPRDLT